jgi:hypothetical protein
VFAKLVEGGSAPPVVRARPPQQHSSGPAGGVSCSQKQVLLEGFSATSDEDASRVPIIRKLFVVLAWALPVPFSAIQAFVRAKIAKFSPASAATSSASTGRNRQHNCFPPALTPTVF